MMKCQYCDGQGYKIVSSQQGYPREARCPYCEGTKVDPDVKKEVDAAATDMYYKMKAHMDANAAAAVAVERRRVWDKITAVMSSCESAANLHGWKTPNGHGYMTLKLMRNELFPDGEPKAGEP